jgi:mono/diheme cytochrome c family protein
MVEGIDTLTGLRYVMLAVVAGMLLAACQPDTGVPDRYSPVGPVPAAPQRSGDAARGYRALLNEPYIRCGMPDSAYRQVATPAAGERLTTGREGRNAELPYALTAYTTPAGVDLVVNNCLACHAATFNGRLIIGLGNESLDFTEDPSLRAEAAGAYVEEPAEAAEWRRWVDRLRVLKPYTVTDTVGVNPAITITLGILAHRDRDTLAWSEQPLIEPPPATPPPTSVPPWWRMKKKHSLFYNTEGRGDHARIMMLGVLLCAEDWDTVKAIDAYAPDIRAYLATIEPPRWPFGTVDTALAHEGEAVFGRACSTCHGTYGKEEGYPNLVVDLATIGTDPIMARFATDGSADRFNRWVNTSFYGELAYSAPAPGYLAPPLDGVWATAPYLHNGSVPTVEALLQSSIRPKYWTRSFRSDDYDPKTLGWRFQSLPYGKEGAKDRAERVRIYDTSLPGYANTGHTFGDALTADERRAVLEYLKTL